MSEYLVLVLAGVVVFTLAILVRLLREHQKLKQQLQVLETQLQRSNADVAGLCSAAVVVDKRMAVNDARLDSILERIARPQPVPTPIPEQTASGGYADVISKIRNGMGIEELVRECGLTRDEAVLLMRLHGGGKRSGLS